MRVSILAAAVLGLAAATLPNPARAQWTGDEIKSARQSMKYCTRKGYFDTLGERIGSIHLACAKNAVMIGDLKQAVLWLDAAQQDFAGPSAADRAGQEAQLIETRGNLAYAQGRYAEARDIWRELYRRQMELDVQAGRFGSFVNFRLLGSRLVQTDDKLNFQEIEAGAKAHPETAALSKSLLADVVRAADTPPTPAMLDDLEARARKLLASDPSSVMGYIALVAVDRKRGDCPALLRDARAEIEHSHIGGLWAAYQAIARCELSAKRYDAALKAYDEAIRVAPWVAENRTERDWVLEWIEKRDHPQAFDYYAAARDGTNGMGKADSEARIVAAWDNINKAIELSPDFPLARSLRMTLFSKNYTLLWKADTDRLRRQSEDDAMRAYGQNPESIQSALAMGLVFYQKPKSEFADTFFRASQWFNVVQARDPENPLGPQFYNLATQAIYQLSPEEQRQRDADNAAYVQRMAEARRIQEQREREKAARPDTFSNMQAWCDSIGASSMQNMAAVPPACYAFVRH